MNDSVIVLAFTIRSKLGFAICLRRTYFIVFSQKEFVMALKCVKDIMVPLDKYAVVDDTVTVFGALVALKESQKNLKPGQFMHRAVLVKNKKGQVIGKIGHLAFLKGLEPKYSDIGDLNILSRAGLTPDFVKEMAIKWNLFKDDLHESCNYLKSIRVTEIMHPVIENIDEEASLNEAVHKIVMWQTLSILVTRDDRTTGLLRLSDLFEEIFGECTSAKEVIS